MGTGLEAWVTVAADNDGAWKALTLAASMRVVCTAKKLVVFASSALGKHLWARLEEAFDWVLKLEPESSDGLSLEDHGKAEALSLVVFKKCVYISPNMLVMNNCDEIFGRCKDTPFALMIDEKEEVDTSIFVFVPCREYKGVATKIIQQNCTTRKMTKVNLFAEWMKMNEHVHLDDKYNVRLALHGARGIRQGLEPEVSVVNFGDTHPLDQVKKNTALSVGTESLEKHVTEYCLEIYMKHVEKHDLESERILQLSHCKSEPIAIVGLSFRFPGGNDVNEFWSLLSEGRSAIKPVPSNRWTKDRTLCANKNEKVEGGFLKDPIDQWDATFFGHSLHDAEYLDPQTRLLLEVTWEALEDALIDPSKLMGTRTGVFAGSWTKEYHEMVLSSVDDDYVRRFLGNSATSCASKISHILGTTGPSIGTDAGCSSGMAAIDSACKSLRNDISSIAIAAGVNLLIRPFDCETFVGYSPTFRCHTFDANADGYVRAEGCGALIMKRLSDAIRDGDNIHGLIRGTAVTQEGVSRSIGTPTAEGESLAMEMALEDADVNPLDVSYLEAHGTGTIVGDPVEILAIERVYSKGRSQTEPLLIGSVKTNVGHTESASGIAGIIKVLLSMKHGAIPKHLNLKTVNPKINLSRIPAQIPLQMIPWPGKPGRPKIAGVNSFGITGMDAHAIIEEPLVYAKPELRFKEERPLHLMKISTKTKDSMISLLQNYCQIFKKIENGNDVNANFADFAYSANIGRATFSHRAVIIGKDFSEAVEQLEKGTLQINEIQSSGKKICFLFTGQGSQYPNMGRLLYATSPIFRAAFDQCDAILQLHYKLCIKEFMWPEDDENLKKLNRTLYSQTSIFVVEYCLLKLWESWGVKPDNVLGHSLGEFAAAVAAEALSLESAIMLVAERSRLIDQLPEGKMLAIKGSKKTVDEVILAFQKIQPDFWADCAALNTLDQTVVSGNSEWIEKFSNFCTKHSLKTTILAASHAFHSRQMDPMLEEYQKFAAITVARRRIRGHASIPVYISGMEGRALDQDSLGAEYWMRHTRESVNFLEACKVLEEEECHLFLEVGPHPVLSALTMKNMKENGKYFPSIRRNESDWITMLHSLAKLYMSGWKGEINWKGFDAFRERKRVKLPFYPFSRKSIWKQYEHVPPKIHPLIGRHTASATRETIYNNTITLKNTHFIEDHVIGNTVIFPGSGFLEMCLAAGHAAAEGFNESSTLITKPRRHVCLKSLRILSPLAIDEKSMCRLQTIATFEDQKIIEDDEMGFSVQVYRQDNTKWVHHAAAKFIPVAPSLATDIKVIEISKIQVSWRKWEGRNAYEALPKLGLHFGLKFQSLGSGWISNEGMLVSLKVPEDYNTYIIHPVIADAMIQSIMLFQNRGETTQKLRVPVQIREFVWVKEATSQVQFTYCSNDENNDIQCLLLDESGTTLARMAGVDFIKTTPKLMEGMIQQQSIEMPQLWEEIWQNSPGPMQGYMSYAHAQFEKIDLSKEVSMVLRELNEVTPEELNLYCNIVQLSKLLFLKALYNLGWKPRKEDNFSVDSVMSLLDVKDNFKRYIMFFLESLVKNNCKILVKNETRETFQFLGAPPAIEELETRILNLASLIDPTRRKYQLVAEIGAKLDKILTGYANPLEIFFPPEDSGKISAGKLYEET